MPARTTRSDGSNELDSREPNGFSPDVEIFFNYRAAMHCGSTIKKNFNSELRTQNPEPRTQNPEPRTQNPELRTQNPEPRTQNNMSKHFSTIKSKHITLSVYAAKQIFLTFKCLA